MSKAGNARKRILLGVEDICGQIGDYREGYESEGHSVFTLVFSRPNFYKGDFSFVLNDLYPGRLLTTGNPLLVLIRKVYSLLFVHPAFYLVFLFQLLRCDICQLMWIPHKKWQFILPLVKFFRKKLIINYVGSDIRHFPSYIQEFDLLGLNRNDDDSLMQNTIRQGITLDDRMRTLRIGEKYADILLSGPDQAQLALRPYHHFYIPLRYENIRFNLPENEVVRVVHASTNRNGYGMDKVRDALYEAQRISKVRFEVEIYENIPNTELMRILSEADIVVYSPFVNGPGKFGLEAMAAGCALLTGYNTDYIKFPPDPPVVNITVEDLVQQLLFYVENREERRDLATRARKWIETHYHLQTICKNLLANAESGPAPDYYPTFFRHTATFDSKWDSPDSVEVCNKWTDYVRDCRWYKQYVEPGERDGLRF